MPFEINIISQNINPGADNLKEDRILGIYAKITVEIIRMFMLKNVFKGIC